jgi:hypothetical protein
MWNAFGAFTVASSPVASEYLAGESGLLVILGYAALGGWLMHTLNRPGNEATQPRIVPQGISDRT